MGLRPTIYAAISRPISGAVIRGGGFFGLANQFPGGAIGLSLRLLNNQFANLGIVNVRRDSDSDTVLVKVDKSFAQPLITLNSPLVGSSATFGDFVSGTDGLVTDWIDQFNIGGNDATQATTTAQPKIVDAGSLVVGGLDFDGLDDFLTSGFVANTQNIAIAAVGKHSNGSGLWAGLDAFNDGYEVNVLNALNFRFSINTMDLDVAGAYGVENLFFCNYDGSTQSASVNGVNSTQAATEVISVTTNSLIASKTTGATRFGGTINELVIWDSDQSANRVGIETNANAAYNIF